MQGCEGSDLRKCVVRLAGNASMRIDVMCSYPVDHLVSGKALGTKPINRAKDPETGNMFGRTSSGRWKIIGGGAG